MTDDTVDFDRTVSTEVSVVNGFGKTNVLGCIKFPKVKQIIFCVGSKDASESKWNSRNK